MPKRSSKKPAGTEHKGVAKEPKESAAVTASMATDGKNPAAVALGRLGGKKGGKARAEKLTAEQRREIAKKAAEARWRKKKQPRK